MVYEALDRQSYKELAIKIVPKDKITSEVLHRRLQREIEIHSRLNHVNVCRMYGYFVDERYVYIVLEYCGNGNLYHPSKKYADICS